MQPELRARQFDLFPGSLAKERRATALKLRPYSADRLMEEYVASLVYHPDGWRCGSGGGVGANAAPVLCCQPGPSPTRREIHGPGVGADSLFPEPGSAAALPGRAGAYALG